MRGASQISTSYISASKTGIETRDISARFKRGGVVVVLESSACLFDAGGVEDLNLRGQTAKVNARGRVVSAVDGVSL